MTRSVCAPSPSGRAPSTAGRAGARAIRPGAPAPRGRAAWQLAAAVLATGAAWVVFARVLPGPMPVVVGTTRTDLPVPLGYQLSVFPVFGATAAAAALDVVRGEARRIWVSRAALVGAIGVLAAARLAGVLPLSGHALFLFGVVGYEIAPPSDRDAPLLCALAAPALLVVAWCKLVVWGDPLWLGASTVLGAALGVALARAARA